MLEKRAVPVRFTPLSQASFRYYYLQIEVWRAKIIGTSTVPAVDILLEPKGSLFSFPSFYLAPVGIDKILNQEDKWW